jgi:hypothetical protein
LATVAASRQSCSGVSRTSRWPIPLWNSASGESSGPTVEAATFIGTVRSVCPMPKFAAVFLSLSAPSSPANCANGTLQECASASLNVVPGQGWPA